MHLSKISQLALVALGFGSSATACVKFSAIDNDGTFNMLLTDNGGLTCWVAQAEIPKGVDLVEFACNPGYSGYFTASDYSVTYQHGSFEGSFGTTYTDYYYGDGSPYDPLKHYQQWTASVWGC